MVVMVILYVRWWSRARLCCDWKLPNLSWRKNPDYEMRKEQILSGIGEDPDWKIWINRRFFWRKMLEITRTTSLIRFWRRSGLTKVYCMSFWSEGLKI